ncbi:hypothetical protein [Reyranella sp.]|uniref:hypothetical protein n=1 Tax=Reyranella sp. TaxID=1929291 RepID=UPI004036F09C
MRRILLPLLGLSLLPAAAQADQAAAAACSAQLSKDGQLLYGKVAPTMTPQTNIKDALTSVARPMVMGGSMSRDTARAAAEAAGECLKLLK